jgi:MFS family permease
MSIWLNSVSAFKYRHFTMYISARFLATLAVQMQSVAVGWQVYDLSGDVMDLGLIGLAQFAPFVLLVLPAGQVADRFRRHRIITGCFLLETVCSVLLTAFALSDLREVWPVFTVMILYGCARAFMMPASQSIVINLVPEDSFKNAVAIGSSSFHVAIILGPTLGGLLYLAGAATVYLIVTLLLLLAVLLMLAVRPISAHKPVSLGKQNSLFDGLRFVRSRPVVLGAISLDLFAVLFGGATALLPAYANDVLQVGPAQLGLLRTATAAGAVMTAIVLAVFPLRRHVGRWMFGGVALFGMATIVFGLSRDFYLSLFALFLMGTGDMISVYVRHLLVQLETPDAIRGRVSAVNSLFIGASNELGEFESGVTADWFGLIPAVIFGGVATLLVTLAWMGWFPVLRAMDAFPSAQPTLGIKPGKTRPTIPSASAGAGRLKPRRRKRRY